MRQEEQHIILPVSEAIDSDQDWSTIIEQQA